MRRRGKITRWILPGFMVVGLLLQGLYFQWQFFGFALVFLVYVTLLGRPSVAHGPRLSYMLAWGWVLLNALSCLWAAHPRGGIVGVLKALVCVSVFFAWQNEARKSSFKVLLAVPLVVSGLLVAVLGFLALDGLVDFPGAVHQGRLASSFQYANAAGALFALSFFSSLMLWVDSRRGLVRIGSLGVGTTSLLALIYTLSRGAWIAVALGIGVWLLLCAWSRARKSEATRRYILETGIYGIGCTLGVAVSSAVGSLGVLGGRVLGAAASLVFSVLYCLPEFGSVRGSRASALRLRPYLAGVLCAALFMMTWTAGRTAQTESITYVTRAGDTLTSIAEGLPVPISGTELYALNQDRIGDPQNLEPGLTLLVPAAKGDLGRAVSVLASISVDTPSFQYRTWAWKDALAVLMAKPWGLGGGGWQSVYRTYETKPYVTGDVHSVFLDVALSSGFLGFLAFVSLFALACLGYLKRLRQGVVDPLDGFPLLLALILLVQSSVDLVFSFTGMALVYWACLGSALACPQDADDAKTGKGIAIRAGTMAAGVLALSLLLGQMCHIRGKRVLAAGDLRGISLLSAGSRLDPLNGDLKADLALAIMLTATRTPETDMQIYSLLESATRLEPGNASHWGELGLLQSALGETEGAIQSLQRAASAHRFLVHWRANLLRLLNQSAALLLPERESEQEALKLLAEADQVWQEYAEFLANSPMEDESIYVERARTLILLGDYAQAAAMLGRCSSPEAGDLLELLGDFGF